MAAYDNVAYIKAAINSVRVQTFRDWELIILGDGSQDGTRELAQALSVGDPRIKFHASPFNQGYNITMVKLSELITGDFVAHIDSDDMLERWAVEEMLIAFDLYPEAHLIYSDMAQIDTKGRVTSYHLNQDFDPKKIYNFGWRAMGMYRRSVFDRIHGYNEKLRHVPGCGDGDLFMQIAEKFNIVHHAKVLYLYRYHGNHTSSRKVPCEECPANPDCNYIRVWAKSLNLDQRTLKPHASPSDIRTPGDGKDDGAASAGEAHEGHGSASGADSVRVVYEGGGVRSPIPAGA